MARQKLNARDAAEVLGISVDALRMRARRGTLEGEHDANGRLYVWLDTDESSDETTDEPQSTNSALTSAKDETIAILREQLAAERQAHGEARRLLAAAMERIPAIAPADTEAPSKVPRTPGDGADSGGAEYTSERQVAADSRSWWRRMFGG